MDEPHILGRPGKATECLLAAERVDWAHTLWKGNQKEKAFEDEIRVLQSGQRWETDAHNQDEAGLSEQNGRPRLPCPTGQYDEERLWCEG